MVRSKKLLDEVLALPAPERAEIASRLIESLDGEAANDGDIEAAWSDDIQKRIAELDAGTVKPVPWSEARRQILGESKAD